MTATSIWRYWKSGSSFPAIFRCMLTELPFCYPGSPDSGGKSAGSWCLYVLGPRGWLHSWTEAVGSLEEQVLGSGMRGGVYIVMIKIEMR